MNRKEIEMSSHEAIDFMRMKGYFVDELILDGKFHRFGEEKERWYVGHGFNSMNGHSIVVLSFGDWKLSEKFTYKTDDRKYPLTPEDRKKINEALEAEKEAKLEEQKRVADDRNTFWQAIEVSNIFPEYLSNKGISDLHGAKSRDQKLYIPLCDVNGKIWSIQTIQGPPNFDKFFYPGGRVSGCFHLIGNLESPQNVFICEGFATGCSIREATKCSVIVAFNANNLDAVSVALKVQFPDNEYIICGDDDCWKEKNVGKEKALKAARRSNSKCVFPVFSEEHFEKKPTDFNDLHVYQGLEAVRYQLLNFPDKSKEHNTEILESSIEGESYSYKKEFIESLRSRLELFHTSADEPFVGIKENGSVKYWPIKSITVKRWLSFIPDYELVAQLFFIIAS